MNVRSKHDDGRIGWPENGPFDAIIVTAAAPALVEALTAQLAPGGMPDRAGRRRRRRSRCSSCARTPTASSPRQALAPVVFVPLLSGMID